MASHQSEACRLYATSRWPRHQGAQPTSSSPARSVRRHSRAPRRHHARVLPSQREKSKGQKGAKRCRVAAPKMLRPHPQTAE
eukprot:2232578-Pleurochrysis_carterae.AAC.2